MPMLALSLADLLSVYHLDCTASLLSLPLPNGSPRVLCPCSQLPNGSCSSSALFPRLSLPRLFCASCALCELLSFLRLCELPKGQPLSPAPRPPCFSTHASLSRCPKADCLFLPPSFAPIYFSFFYSFLTSCSLLLTPWIPSPRPAAKQLSLLDPFHVFCFSLLLTLSLHFFYLISQCFPLSSPTNTIN